MAASAFSVFSGRMLDQGNPMRIDAKQKHDYLLDEG